MPSPRAPWWMYVVATSYFGYVALGVYQVFWGTVVLPWSEGGFRSGNLVILSVQPNSLDERAGLRAGDRVLAVDGQVIRSFHDWEAIRANTEIGRPERWEIARANERLELTFTFPRATWSERFSAYRGLVLIYFPFVLTSSLLGLMVAFSRPHDPVARMGAWLLATGAVALGLGGAWAATWRHLPGPLGLLLWIPQISRFVSDAILFSFFAIFPRKIFSARWPWLLLWIPTLALLPWRIFGAYQVVYEPGHATDVPPWLFSAIALRSVAYVMGSVVALVLSYRRLEDANQRRRVRVLEAGVLASLLGVLGWIAILSGRALSSWLEPVQVLFVPVLLAFPLSFTYAILRHRLFDIRVMIRQGLQYALARGVLISTVPVLALILLGDLLLHGKQPLVGILQARGWVYAALGGLALVTHARRKQRLETLDRRFFRERYDAQLLLREVVGEVHRAGNLEREAPHVVARIEAALHPEFVALLVREPRQSNYCSLAAAPSGQAPPPLPAESKLMALVRVLGKPVEISLSESGWLKQQLPHEETDFLRQARIDLLVPIATESGRGGLGPPAGGQPTPAGPESPPLHDQSEALLVLGAKRSEEPYTREDQDLLVAIATSLALLMEKVPAPPPRVSEAFEECPQCGACYDTGAGRCAQEGSSLLPVHLPRLLAGRYRLERRRGRGGMGTVYEATDTALERRVAIKVIRDELVGSAEAADRFRREARAAASFAHPNVVTIHDFGVAAETRAFLVMELLQGLSLREDLKREKRIEPARTVAILRGVCDAVEAAHRRQLVHRDLKPENIFLAQTETGETPKVLDFGIAKFLPVGTQATADTGTGALLGTMAYLLPEHWLGQPVDASWDVWALAVVAYEMLTGAQPFTGATAAEWQVAVLAGNSVPLARHLPEGPAGWQEFFVRAFAVDRAHRPDSAGAFFSGLERALS